MYNLISCFIRDFCCNTLKRNEVVHLEKEKSELIEWLKAIVIGAVFAIVIQTFMFEPVSVQGASMMPTYEDGDRVIVNKIGKAISDFERFDIVVFKATESEDYIKRIIGVPGDHIEYKNDELYINGEKYEEPYLEQYKLQLNDTGVLTYDFTLEEITGFSHIPEGYYFVLGDNRRVSNDSRNPNVGLISIDDILGKASIRFYPLDSISFVK